MAEQRRILVVEGEESLNWNIVNSLQKDGYIVLGVTGGAEAIRTLWSEEYDVVICSQQMPDADGFDLLQWMRTYCPNARMVMLGVPGGVVGRTQALEMGVSSYLEQPLDLHALKEELRRMLHSTGFSASLDSFDLLDVIQIITMSRKSIALVVSTGLEEQGTLRFQGGELISAEYGTLRGEEAFFALAAHKNGTVVHRPWSDQITPNVTQPLSRLIFQALQYRSKYAEHQQLSSEVEAVKPGGTVPDPPTLPPLPPTMIPEALLDLEDDDRPFQFVAEDFSSQQVPASPVFEQLVSNSSTNSGLEQMRGGMGVVRNTEQGTMGSSDGKEKAWWEPTGAFPSLQMSGSMRAVTGEEPGRPLPSNGMSITPSTVHKTGMGQNNGLPSWLTDQPTHMDLPVLRGNTGQMPAAPKESSPVLPQTPSATFTPASPLPSISAMSPVSPALPNLPQHVSAEWPALPQPGAVHAAHASDSGLRKIKPEDSMLTAPHRVVKPGSNQTIGAMRPAQVEWQGPTPASLPGQSGQMAVVKPERTGDTLKSLAALKKPAVSPATDSRSAGSGQGTSPMKAVKGTNGRLPAQPAAGAPARRNYPALAAALQTLGYSVQGFVASAVVSIDGTPIAQVAVDEMDIAPMCAHFSSIVRGATQALELGNGEDYEHTVITSRAQHILLRVIGKKKDVFQVLITTRETTPAESLDVMANVEAAIVTALQ